jgi:hypothetical protein
MKKLNDNYLWADEKQALIVFEREKSLCDDKIVIANLCCYSCRPTAFDHHKFHTICNY